jgi:hypothetical protein
LPSPCPGAQRLGDGPGPTAELCVMTTFSITSLKFTLVLAGGGSDASLSRLSESRESHILAATYSIGASPFRSPANIRTPRSSLPQHPALDRCRPHKSAHQTHLTYRTKVLSDVDAGRCRAPSRLSIRATPYRKSACISAFRLTGADRGRAPAASSKAVRGTER